MDKFNIINRVNSCCIRLRLLDGVIFRPTFGLIVVET